MNEKLKSPMQKCSDCGKVHEEPKRFIFISEDEQKDIVKHLRDYQRLKMLTNMLCGVVMAKLILELIG